MDSAKTEHNLISFKKVVSSNRTSKEILGSELKSNAALWQSTRSSMKKNETR